MDVLCLVRPDGIDFHYLSKLVGIYVLNLLPKQVTLCKILEQFDTIKDDNQITVTNFEDGLLLLREFSLVSFENDATIHPMVQKVARIYSEYKAGCILPKLEIESTTAPELRHVISIWKHVSTKHPKLIHEWKKLDLPNKLYFRMQLLPMINEMMSFSEYNYKLYSIVYSKDCVEYLSAESQVAHAMYKTGNFSAAYEKYVEILARADITKGVTNEFKQKLKFHSELAKLQNNLLEGKLNEITETGIHDTIEGLTNLWVENMPDNIDFDKFLKILLRDKPLSELMPMVIKLKQISKNKDSGGLEKFVTELVSTAIPDPTVDKVAELLQSVSGNQSMDKGDDTLHFLMKLVLGSCKDLEALSEGRTEDAAIGAESQYQSLLNKFGENYSTTIMAKSCKADMLWDNGNKKEALAIKTEVVEEMKTNLGMTHQVTIANSNILSGWETEMRDISDTMG